MLEKISFKKPIFENMMKYGNIFGIIFTINHYDYILLTGFYYGGIYPVDDNDGSTFYYQINVCDREDNTNQHFNKTHKLFHKRLFGV